MVEQDGLGRLYSAISDSTHLDVGTETEFREKMQTPEQLKSFYDMASSQGVDLGDYNEYESKLKKKASPEEFQKEFEKRLYTPSQDNIQSESVFPKTDPWLDTQHIVYPMSSVDLTDEDKVFLSRHGETPDIQAWRLQADLPTRVNTMIKTQEALFGMASFSPPEGLAPSERDEYWRQRTLTFFAEREMQHVLEHQIAIEKERQEAVGQKTGVEYLREYGFKEKDWEGAGVGDEVYGILDDKTYMELSNKFPDIQESRVKRIEDKYGKPNAAEYQLTGYTIGSGMGKALMLASSVLDTMHEIGDPDLDSDFKRDEGEGFMSAALRRYREDSREMQEFLALRDNPTMLENAALGIGTVAMDAPLFLAGSTVWSKAGRALMSIKYTKNLLKSIGIADDVANVTAKRAFSKMSSSTGGAGAFAGHAAVNNVLTQLGDKDIDDFSFGELYKETWQAGVTGRALSWFNFGANVWAQRVYDRQANKIFFGAPDAASTLRTAMALKGGAKAAAFAGEMTIFEVAHLMRYPGEGITFPKVVESGVTLMGLHAKGFALHTAPKVREKKANISLTPDEKATLGVKDITELKEKYKSKESFNELFKDDITIPLATQLKVTHLTGRGNLTPPILAVEVVQKDGELVALGQDGRVVDRVTLKNNPTEYARGGEYQMMAEYNRNIINLADQSPDVRNEIDAQLKKAGIERGLSAQEGIGAATRGASGHTERELKFMTAFNEAVKTAELKQFKAITDKKEPVVKTEVKQVSEMTDKELKDERKKAATDLDNALQERYLSRKYGTQEQKDVAQEKVTIAEEKFTSLYPETKPSAKTETKPKQEVKPEPPSPEQIARQQEIEARLEEVKKTLDVMEGGPKGKRSKRKTSEERTEALLEMLRLPDKITEDVKREALERNMVEGSKEYKKYVKEESKKRNPYQDIPDRVFKRMVDKATEANLDNSKYREARNYIDKALKDADFRRYENERISLEEQIVKESDVIQGGKKKEVSTKLFSKGEIKETIPTEKDRVIPDIERINALVNNQPVREFESESVRSEINRLESKHKRTPEEQNRLVDLRSQQGKGYIKDPRERIDKNIEEITSLEKMKDMSVADMERIEFLKHQNRILNYANIKDSNIYALKDMLENLQAMKEGRKTEAQKAREEKINYYNNLKENVWLGLNRGRGKHAKELEALYPEYSGLLAKAERTEAEDIRLDALTVQVASLKRKLRPLGDPTKTGKSSLMFWYHENFISTLNRIMRGDNYQSDKLPIYKDRLNEAFLEKMTTSTNKMNDRNREYHEMFMKDLRKVVGGDKEISEARFEYEIAKMSTDRRVNIDLVLEGGNTIPHALTPMQAMEKVLQWRDVDGRRSMEVPLSDRGGISSNLSGMGYTQKTIDQILKQLDPTGDGKSKEIRTMDWVKKTYDYYADIYDQAYIREYGVSFRIPGYNWMIEKMTDKPTSVVKIGEGFIDASVRKDRAINRDKKNVSPLKEGDILKDLYGFVDEAARFEAWAPTLREMQYVFKDRNIRDAILMKDGAAPLRIIDDYLNIFAGQSPKSNEMWMDVLAGNFARASLGFKASPMLKQSISSMYYGLDMPLWKVPASVFNGVFSKDSHAVMGLLREHPFYLDRVSSMAEASGQEVRDTMKKLYQGYKNPNFTVHFGRKMLHEFNAWSGMPLKYGDIAPIVISGAEYTAHKFKEYSGKPLTERIVNDYRAGKLTPELMDHVNRSLKDWNIMSMVTQQSLNPMNRTYASTLGGWQRAATLFTSGPLAAHRAMMYNKRELVHAMDTGDWNRAWKASKNMFIAHSLSGAVFSMFDNRFSFDKPEDWTNLGLGVLIGNINGLYVAGKQIDVFRRHLTDVDFGGGDALSVSPVLDNLDRLSKASVKFYEAATAPVTDITDLKMSATEFGLRSTMFLGFPVDGVLKLRKGISGLQGSRPLTKEEEEAGMEPPENIRETDNFWSLMGMFAMDKNPGFIEESVPDSLTRRNLKIMGMETPITYNLSAYTSYDKAKQDAMGLTGVDKNGVLKVADPDLWSAFARKAHLGGYDYKLLIDWAFDYRMNKQLSNRYGRVKSRVDFQRAQAENTKRLKEVEKIINTSGKANDIRRAQKQKALLESDREFLDQVKDKWLDKRDEIYEVVLESQDKLMDMVYDKREFMDVMVKGKEPEIWNEEIPEEPPHFKNEYWAIPEEEDENEEEVD